MMSASSTRAVLTMTTAAAGAVVANAAAPGVCQAERPEEVPGSQLGEVLGEGPDSAAAASALFSLRGSTVAAPAPPCSCPGLPRIYPWLPVVRHQLGKDKTLLMLSDSRSLLMLSGPGQAAGQAMEAVQDPQLGGSMPGI